jgi:hypothetical protein
MPQNRARALFCVNSARKAHSSAVNHPSYRSVPPILQSVTRRLGLRLCALKMTSLNQHFVVHQ